MNNREKLKNDILRVLMNTWLSTDSTIGLVLEQQQEAENQLRKLANGIADAVEEYVVQELNRIKSFLIQPGAFTGKVLSDSIEIDSSGSSLANKLVSIEPGSIKNYTPSGG